MKREDLLSIMVTFMMGAVAGGYLYLTQVAQFGEQISTPELVDIIDFSVEGEGYGACGIQCQSFYIADDGSYRYLFYSENDQEKTSVEGNLPFKTMYDLRQAAKEDVLADQSKRENKSRCPALGETLVRYEVTLNGQEYRIDTCSTEVDTESELWQALVAAREHIETTESNP